MATYMTPNMRGLFFVGISTPNPPTSRADFEFNLTQDPIYGITDVQVTNEVETTDFAVYGQNNKVKVVISYMKTYEVTVMVAPEDGDFYNWLEELANNPLGAGAKVSILDTFVYPDGNNPVYDLYSPEAQVSIDNSPHFGTAGELTTVVLTITPVIELKKIAPLPESPLDIAPTLTFPNGNAVFYATTDVKTIGDIKIDMPITAMSGDGTTDLTTNIEIISSTGVVLPGTTPLDMVVGTTTYMAKIEEGGKSAIAPISVQISTDGLEPTVVKTKK